MRLTLLACCLLFAGATISTSISAAEEPAQTKAKKGKKGPDSAVDERFLSGSALADLFPDTQISHVNPDSGADVIMFFHADGKLSGSATQRRGSRSGTSAPLRAIGLSPREERSALPAIKSVSSASIWRGGDRIN